MKTKTEWVSEKIADGINKSDDGKIITSSDQLEYYDHTNEGLIYRLFGDDDSVAHWVEVDSDGNVVREDVTAY